MERRTFLKATGAALISSVINESSAAIVQKTKIEWSQGMKPLYCLAYIDPLNKLHKNQEQFIARYPITVIPQDSQASYFQFRNRLRKLNPDQKVLAYQVVLDENELRGPGHERIRKLNNSWLELPGGVVPTINVKSGGKYKEFRLYDPRDPLFRSEFVESCKTMVNKNGFDGIFLDNCTIYARFASVPFWGDELKAALQQLILEVRDALPNAILIGNSRYNWDGLNGEMNEGRPNELAQEMTSYPGHVEPAISFYHYYMKNNNDVIEAEKHLKLAIENQCFFGTGINAQTIKWYPFFDSILSKYEII